MVGYLTTLPIGIVGQGIGPTVYTGPADVITGWQEFWGLRSVSANTAGNRVIRVINSASAQADINSLHANGALDLATLASFLGGNPGTVLTFYGQVNGNHLTQATPANQATITAAGVVTFDGATTFYQSLNAFNVTSPFTMSLMVALTSLTQSMKFATFGTSGHQISVFYNSAASPVYTEFYSSDGVQTGFYFWYGNQGYALEANKPYAVYQTFNGASSFMGVDGATSLNANMNSSGTPGAGTKFNTANATGNFILGGTTGLFAPMTFYEVGIINGLSSNASYPPLAYNQSAHYLTTKHVTAWDQSYGGGPFWAQNNWWGVGRGNFGAFISDVNFTPSATWPSFPITIHFTSPPTWPGQFPWGALGLSWNAPDPNQDPWLHDAGAQVVNINQLTSSYNLSLPDVSTAYDFIYDGFLVSAPGQGLGHQILEFSVMCWINTGTYNFVLANPYPGVPQPYISPDGHSWTVFLNNISPAQYSFIRNDTNSVPIGTIDLRDMLNYLVKFKVPTNVSANPNLTGLEYFTGADLVAEAINSTSTFVINDNSYQYAVDTPVSMPAGWQAFWGLRGLTTTPTKAIQVRRADTGVTTDIFTLANQALDINGPNGLVAALSGTTGTVSIIYDQTGHGYNLIQTTVGKQAAISISPLKLVFDGTSSSYTTVTTFQPFTTPYGFSYCGTVRGVTGRNLLHTSFQSLSVSGNDWHAADSVAGADWQFTGTLGNTLANNRPYALGFGYNGSSSFMAVNGVAQLVSTLGSTLLAYPLNSSLDLGWNGGANFTALDFYEGGIYGSDFNQSVAATLAYAQAVRWGGATYTLNQANEIYGGGPWSVANIPRIVGYTSLTSAVPTANLPTSVAGTVLSWNMTGAVTAPTVTSVTPNIGPLAGRSVTISGSSFISVPTIPTVTFGTAPATSVSVVNSSTINCTAPAHAVGIVNVVVTTANGSSAANNPLFTYAAAPTITSITPPSGTTAGGTAIQIVGTGFIVGATTITIGGATPTSIVIASTTLITCTTPTGSGTATVAITTIGGTVNGSFTYTSPGTAPVVQSVSDVSTGLAEGSTGGNRPVSISGSNFTNATQVTIGGVAVQSFTVNSSTSISCRTSKHAAGTASVVVTTPAGANGANTLYTYVMKAGGSTLTPPTLASANGFNTLSFQEEFDNLLSVNTAEQILSPGNRTYPNTFVGQQTNVAGPQPGYNFYCQAFGWLNAFDPVQRTGDNSGIQYCWAEYYGITGSVLHIVGRNGGRDTMGGLVSVATVDQHQAFAGTPLDFANGFYWEIRAQLPPFGFYFDFWNFSVDALTGANAVWVEIDAPEFLTDRSGQIDMLINTWQGNPSVPTTVGGNTGGFFTISTATTAMHVYGALFLPPVGGNPGSVQLYADGTLRNTFSIPASGSTGLPVLSNQHRNQLKITASAGLNDNYTQYIDYVRVWQATANG